MDLRKTLQLVHSLFAKNDISHALIGGLGLACYGSTRATIDLDLLIHEDDKYKAKNLLEGVGFKIDHESEEVLQFSGVGFVDLLLARRPISQDILKNANTGGPEGISFVTEEALIGLKIQAYSNNPKREFQDKADIQFLIESDKDLDWAVIKKYADLFEEWEAIVEIRNKCKS